MLPEILLRIIPSFGRAIKLAPCTWDIQSRPFAACWAHFVTQSFSTILIFLRGSQLHWFCPEIFPFFPFFLCILGLPFLIIPESWKWEKGIHPKGDETQGFQYLGNSNWIINNLLSWFCPEIFHHPELCILGLPFLGLPFLITPESGNEKKGFTQKWMRHRYTWYTQYHFIFPEV